MEMSLNLLRVKDLGEVCALQCKSRGPLQSQSYFLADLFIVINSSVGPSADLCQGDSSNRQRSGITEGKKITTVASG